MSWKPFGDDVEFREAHDALACSHEEPLHVPMKKMSSKPFGDDVEFGEAHDALACAHEEPLHVPMKKMMVHWSPCCMWIR